MSKELEFWVLSYFSRGGRRDAEGMMVRGCEGAMGRRGEGAIGRGCKKPRGLARGKQGFETFIDPRN